MSKTEPWEANEAIQRHICTCSAITLRSDDIEVTVVPQEGGRISSLHSIQSGLEFLTQAHRAARPLIRGSKPPSSVAHVRELRNVFPQLDHVPTAPAAQHRITEISGRSPGR